jgi:hypothetical protein
MPSAHPQRVTLCVMTGTLALIIIGWRPFQLAGILACSCDCGDGSSLCKSPIPARPSRQRNGYARRLQAPAVVRRPAPTLPEACQGQGQAIVARDVGRCSKGFDAREPSGSVHRVYTPAPKAVPGAPRSHLARAGAHRLACRPTQAGCRRASSAPARYSHEASHWRACSASSSSA